MEQLSGNISSLTGCIPILTGTDEKRNRHSCEVSDGTLSFRLVRCVRTVLESSRTFHFLSLVLLLWEYPFGLSLFAIG